MSVTQPKGAFLPFAHLEKVQPEFFKFFVCKPVNLLHP